MENIIRKIEKITNQKGLSLGIDDSSDVKILVASLGLNTKTELKKELGLDDRTTDSELVRLIEQQINDSDSINQEIEDVKPIDLDGVNLDDLELFDEKAQGQSNSDFDLDDFLENPDLQDSDLTKNGSEGDGDEGDSEDESDGFVDDANFTGDDFFGANGQGDQGNESDGEGDQGDDGDQEKETDKIEDELIEFGYRPLFLETSKIFDKGTQSGSMYKYKENTKYSEILYEIGFSNNYFTYRVTVVFDDLFLINYTVNIENEDNSFVITRMIDYTVTKENGITFSDGSKSIKMKNNINDKSDLFNEFKDFFEQDMNEFNSVLLKEAEVNQEFLKNINKK